MRGHLEPGEALPACAKPDTELGKEAGSGQPPGGASQGARWKQGLEFESGCRA